MATALKRSIALLLVLVLAFGMIPTAFAEETEATDSTIPTEEILTEKTAPPAEETDTQETVVVTEETTVPTENMESPVLFLGANSIEALADPEITGAPNAFANLTLPNGGIDIPAQGYMQHKKVLPLYSLYLKNQTGYANNYYVAYCIEPGVELANSGGHDGTAYTVNDMVDGSGALYRINRDQVEAIGIALLYGQKEIASKKDEQTLRYEKLCRHAATQAIVWELACGWRSPYRLTELEAPEGYSLLSGPAFEGRLPAEELTVSLRVVNCEQFTLPQTGSTSALLLRISQVLCIAICATLLMFGHRKERKQ